MRSAILGLSGARYKLWLLTADYVFKSALAEQQAAAGWRGAGSGAIVTIAPRPGAVARWDTRGATPAPPLAPARGGWHLIWERRQRVGGRRGRAAGARDGGTAGTPESPRPLQHRCSSSPAALGDAARGRGQRGRPSASSTPGAVPAPAADAGSDFPNSGGDYPPYHPRSTASPWKPAALRLPPCNQRGHF